ncbi:hypothetical protein VF14_21975 [Nostoc linckia z18]|uniref:Uncharacterized protein n=2 Tax=Nostoc linckia TaxID=92942 RepID=A0A9Q6EK07_NOSLI|nr:hypothetical protein [Nostoc linckia]PHK39733.1 hypothetical protein VF12_13150 [Nostoc linckia z15]PHK44259.1 hypothetical protein VF13_22705 [Nostoc linckia z16]PHJ57226.1 hypothetical protein VF02_30785 [Nostoc linckia z1]PHJ59496.1 hypothetical protein VF05_31975 [Nostoc linckia z3]PHJ64085.1 hypothetical protein VF03_29480 [Nostoc linckia z2]
MYYPNDIEEICYEQNHIEKVWDEMKQVIPTYFQQYIDTESGYSIPESEIEKLAVKFGSTCKPKSKPKDTKKILERLLKESIKDYEKDRQRYQDILDLESLSEYKFDVSAFKNTILRNQIPIINKTLKNIHAKELDKFRAAFNTTQPGDLFKVIYNIVQLANEWHNEWYKEKEFEEIDTCDGLEYYELDKEAYIAYGVIGGGIKSHFIYKLFPEMYPNRSREAIWALYYLSSKKKFGCKEDSQFLMINAREGTTQQNYFYPYALFSFYAIRIYRQLKELYAKHGVSLPIEYRFVLVDSFLSFVARNHQAEIDDLKKKAESYHYEY